MFVIFPVLQHPRPPISRVPVTPSVSHKSESWQQTQDTGSHWSQHMCQYLCRTLYHYLMDVYCEFSPGEELTSILKYISTLFYGFHIVLSTPWAHDTLGLHLLTIRRWWPASRINHPEPGHLLAGPFPVIILKTWESPGAITLNNTYQCLPTVNKRNNKKWGGSIPKNFHVGSGNCGIVLI